MASGDAIGCGQQLLCRGDTGEPRGGTGDHAVMSGKDSINTVWTRGEDKQQWSDP